MSDEALEKLLESVEKEEGQVSASLTKERKGKIEGCYSYDILANQDKAWQFQYVPHHYSERNKFVINEHKGREEEGLYAVDLVRLAVDFAYLDEAEAKNFSFSKYIEKHRE